MNLLGLPINGSTRRLLPAIILFAGALSAAAQTAQFDQAAILYSPSTRSANEPYQRGVNYRSSRGVPLSNTKNTPVGSDGRAVAGSSPNQFMGLLPLGGVVRPLTPLGLVNGAGTTNYTQNAVGLGLPTGKKAGAVVLVLRSAQLGGTYLSRPLSFLFGAVIQPPVTDENGAAIPAGQISTYWRTEPYSTNDHDKATYYWSPHMGAVIANAAGPVSIFWRRSNGSATLATNGLTAGKDYVLESGNYYRLTNSVFVVSGSPIKPPRRIYWSYGSFAATGKPVAVPNSRVSAIAVAYTAAFPSSVAEEYKEEGTGGFPTGFTQTNTLWYESTATLGNLQAYNAEGRVIVELLGEPLGGNTRRSLGYEIVDVVKRPDPSDLRADLGQRIAAYGDGKDDSDLTASPFGTITQGLNPYLYPWSVAGSEQTDYYAARESQNLNEVVVFWLETGIAGLKWPKVYARYQLGWPTDIASYSHYIRPPVDTEDEAKQTAVPLPAGNAPFIQWQDPLDSPRGSIIPESSAFYTYLDGSYPAHRALLRLTSGSYVRFERIFSWLGQGLQSGSMTNSVAAGLSVVQARSNTNWLAAAPTSPRLFKQNVQVGQRISAPPGEPGATGGYLAGYVRQAAGNSYHPTAYKDPFVEGFDVANQGAIIPVNAVPGTNKIEVWWFRPNQVATTDLARGFGSIYWPAVIGTYTVVWPAEGSANYSEIVLASNAGSGALGSLQAKGRIYAQNDPLLPGYNPNEEHALVLGGQVYALRDDLNLTLTNAPATLSGQGATYSSAPYVLLDYTEADGRPALRPFKVLREKPAAGIVFDYIVSAGGTPLQAPMPLPFLSPPVEGSGASQKNYNTEPQVNSADYPVGWTDSSPLGAYAGYSLFTYQDRKGNFWVQRGQHAGLPALQAGTYNTNSATFTNGLTAAAVVGKPFNLEIHTSRRTDSMVAAYLGGQTPMPPGLGLSGTTLKGTPSSGGIYRFSLRLTDNGDGQSVTNNFTITVRSSGGVTNQGPLVMVSTNAYSGANVTYTGRPPFLASAATNTNCFTMRFYYKTQDGFAWPGLDAPTNGSIVPYLRPVGSTALATDKNTAALDIVYRPVWPSDPPRLAFGQTLTAAQTGLPAIRGQSSVQLLYQQSIAANLTNATPAVVLFDPTSDKAYALTDGTTGLGSLPPGVKAEAYQGRTYFPNLPPHLAQRFYLDPSRGTKGSLVLRGQFKKETLGESYLLLNVLKGTDLAAVQALCPLGDTLKSQWDTAISSLRATVVTTKPDPVVPGRFIADDTLTKTVEPGDLIGIRNSRTLVDSYALSAAGPGQGYVTLITGDSDNTDQTPAADPVSLYVLRVTGDLYRGELKNVAADNPFSELVTLQHSLDLGGNSGDYRYQYQIGPTVDGNPPASYQDLADANGIPNYILGGSGIRSLVDNWVKLRYTPINTSHPRYNPTNAVWSEWTDPILVEGWIKRVLSGVNPFNQRVTDLYSHTVNTDANILTSAGKRWEGDVPLNLANVNDLGLIEIYETVLRRGRGLSIDAGVNFGPANDALLLAAGYLSDLYMLVGNEAYADASNPTIGIGTKDKTYGDIATSLFSFKGQLPSLLEEELALLRGRDDTLQPGVGLAPVYNRLIWNYTRGIASGEVIYALNYNILDQNQDGKVDAADAGVLYPQGHGDAYGHYLTAVKGYYSLLLNPNFDWVPRSEVVNILGKPVAVDYLDERKFATAAVAVTRTGRQVFDLVWRRDYLPGQGLGWERFSNHRDSSRTVVNGAATNQLVRHWGADQWASRTAQGALFNWVVGNTILPPVDPDPSHEGIQKIDRTTVPELGELATILGDLQTALDNAEGRLTPLGLPDGGVAFDIDPNKVTGVDAKTHFEQVYDRAKQALNNAVASFDDAKDVTRLMRSEQDSLADLQNGYQKQELAYDNSIIELYGTPYAGDIGTGKTYPQGYTGPDYYHYMWVEDTTFADQDQMLWNPDVPADYGVDIGVLPGDYAQTLGVDDFVTRLVDPGYEGKDPQHTLDLQHHITYPWGPHGFLDKPATITGKRVSPGKIQQAISEVVAAHDNLYVAITDQVGDKEDLDKQAQIFDSRNIALDKVSGLEASIRERQKQSIVQGNAQAGLSYGLETAAAAVRDISDIVSDSLPQSMIFGLANGGDALSPGRAAIKIAGSGVQQALLYANVIAYSTYLGLESQRQNQLIDLQHQIDGVNRTEETKQMVVDLALAQKQVMGHFTLINQGTRRMDDAMRSYAALVAQADRIQTERQVYRQHAAAVIQGYRSRDAAFRLFRNEKLERYKTLFDLASRYAYLAATAYDYETGLLNTDAGRGSINRIVNSRALGVVKNGEPQYAGSDTGDPGLSSALAEMKADWDVLKGRLGFNNPDAYGTTVSLRQEALRILPGADGAQTWQDALQSGRTDNLLTDSDVKRYCLQIDPGNGLPVPGIVLTFGTSINPGENLFGRPLAAGDSAFHRSAFATKIFAAGVALEGYRGMNDPTANGSAVGSAGGASPSDPASIDPQALAATPYIYLIPVGADSMRSPPLGDASGIRTWDVQDVAIPMPFNIGASDFSSKKLYQSADSLSESMFGIRGHQAFRPVSTTAAFGADVYGAGGGLQPSQFTNRRLIGRSIWNSRWKLVIPGDTLLNDPKEGLARLIQTVTDIKLHFVTYSYSGN